VRLFSPVLSFGNRTQNSRVEPIGGSDPNHQGIWSPPRAGRVFITAGPLIKLCVGGRSKNFNLVNLTNFLHYIFSNSTREIRRPMFTRPNLPQMLLLPLPCGVFFNGCFSSD
jgi:hypothetical protein